MFKWWYNIFLISLQVSDIKKLEKSSPSIYRDVHGLSNLKDWMKIWTIIAQKSALEITQLSNVLIASWKLINLIDFSGEKSDEEEDPDIAKIKKVQSFFRGWLCRRRWKQIVDEYIRSPHAESMRKRNW